MIETKYVCDICGEEFTTGELSAMFMHIVYGHDIAPKDAINNTSMR